MATETRVSNEIEIASKKIQVGKRNYYVDLKQNQKGMFIKFVEVLVAAKASRIVIPMSVAKEFHEKLLEITSFLDSYDQRDTTTTAADKSADKFATTVKSTQLFVLNRRFYFDLKESSQGRLILRISLVSSTNRININIFAEAVKTVADIIGDFIKEHPPQKVDGPKRQPRNFQQGGETVAKNVEATPKTDKTKRTKADKPPRQQLKPLVVLADPAPEVFTVDGRTYTFELVSGEDHTFLRVCEQKSFKKSTMHIPLDLCEKWMNTCGSFVKCIPASAIEAAMKSKTTAVPSST